MPKTIERESIDVYGFGFSVCTDRRSLEWHGVGARMKSLANVQQIEVNELRRCMQNGVVWKRRWQMMNTLTSVSQ